MILIAATLGAFLGGCSSTQHPTLTVVSATMKERTPQGVVMEFVLDADNPNGDSLPLRDVTYEVTLEGQKVFEGTRSAEATLRRYGRQQVRLPAVCTLADGAILPAAAKYRISGDMVYVVPGAIAETLFDVEVLRPSVSFVGEGTVETAR